MLKPLNISLESRYNQTYINQPKRTEKRKHIREFIGVDGEGVTYRDEARDWWDEKPVQPGSDEVERILWEGRRHEYVLLSVGDSSLHDNGKQLSTLTIFEFLWEEFQQNPNSIFVGFYLSYDFTQWLRDLPENRARILLSKEGIAKRQRKIGRNVAPFPVEWSGWEFDLLDMRRFKLRPKGHGGRYLWVSDVGSFFQTSFLAAIDPKNWPEPILSNDEFATIKAGKGSRSDAKFDPSMIKYNTLENDVLGRMMHSLAYGFDKMNVKLNSSQWYGPGQAASKWLSNIKAPDSDIVKYNVPVEVQEAARASYYGGWFEQFAHGHINQDVYEYDINSAYPYAIADLPCLEHGEWVRKVVTTKDAFDPYCLVLTTVKGSNKRIGTMPHRTAQGAICRPSRTKGWHWLNEILAAKSAGCIDDYQIHDAWSFLPTCYHKPFESIVDLYQDRLKVGKNTPLGKAYKLIYNSAYGKLAQSVGSPRYANPIYASLITSICRTRIWEAIATHPNKADAVTMIATDAVYFLTPHFALPVSDKLGEWDYAVRKNICQFMPGIYWDDDARSGGKIKSRGIAMGDLNPVIEEGDKQWRQFRTQLPSRQDWGATTDFFGCCLAYPRLQIPIKFGLITAKAAIHRNSWSECGAVVSGPKYLSSSPHNKRDPFSAHVLDDIIWTKPYDVSDKLESTPYEKRFGMELRDWQDDNIITKDGLVDDEMYEWIHSSV